MTWVLLSLGTAVFYALQGAWTKRIVPATSVPIATWAIFAFSFPLLLLYLAARGVPAVGPRFWPALATNVLLLVLSFRLYVSALARGDLGITYPLLALTPLLLVPVEWLLLGDVPGPRGLAGVVLVVSGVYLLGYDPGRTGLLEPLRSVLRDPGARRMLGVAAIWAVTAAVDRVAVLASSPAVYGVALSGAIGAALLPSALRHGRASAVRRRGAVPLLAVQGLLFAAMFVCQMEALRLSLAANVVTIKRGGAILGVGLGAAFFGERFPGWRTAGAVVIVAGAYLVARG